jgi:predicted dithiol-disulfide oxidoreductase (DUF899 family)
MKNHQAVNQWIASINPERAYDELTRLRKKYPWLKCDESYAMLAKLMIDLPKLNEIIKQQEKQLALHNEFIRVSRMADEAIVHAVASKAGITL